MSIRLKRLGGLPKPIREALERHDRARAAKPTKYHSRNAVDGMGVVYDSEHEMNVAEWLRYEVRSGRVFDWHWGPRMLLQRDPEQPNTLITYRPDFIVWPVQVSETGFKAEPWYALDAKGMRTKEFNLKARLWKVAYPDHPLYVIGKDMVMRPA